MPRDPARLEEVEKASRRWRDKIIALEIRVNDMAGRRQRATIELPNHLKRQQATIDQYLDLIRKEGDASWRKNAPELSDILYTDAVSLPHSGHAPAHLGQGEGFEERSGPAPGMILLWDGPCVKADGLPRLERFGRLEAQAVRAAVLHLHGDRTHLSGSERKIGERRSALEPA